MGVGAFGSDAAASARRGALPWSLGRHLKDAALPVAFVVGFFALWEAVIVGFGVPRYILPAPSRIFVQLVRNFPRIWDYTLVTGGESLSGFAVAILVAIPLALLIAFSRVLRQTLFPAAVTLEM